MEEGDYTYMGQDQACKFDADRMEAAAMTMGFHTLPHNDYLALMDHLANDGDPTPFKNGNNPSLA